MAAARQGLPVRLDSNNNGELYRLFEIGGGPPFLEMRAEKGTHSTRVLRRRLPASRSRGDPDGPEELLHLRD